MASVSPGFVKQIMPYLTYHLPVRVRVTLRLAVSQSWCRAPSGTMTRFLVLYNDYYGLCPLGAPSDERVGLSFSDTGAHGASYM
jgi:hypothetical protein